MTKPAAHSIFFRDCRDCSNIPDATIDLVVTSPPYPMIEMWDDCFSRMAPGIADAFDREDGPQAFETAHAELDRVWAETHRTLKDGGFLCVNIGDATRTIGGTFRLYPNHSRIMQACLRLGFDALPMIHWWKPTNAPNKFMGSGMLPAGAYVTLEHEYVLIFRKGGKREFPGAEQKKARGGSAYFWEERNAWFSDTWDLTGMRQELNNGAARQRSAAFPFELAYRLINMYSVKGDTVLDPFLGTGTTVLAAIASARNSTGVELDPSFKAMIEERVLCSKDELNGLIRERLGRHRGFIAERLAKGKELKHYNDYHDFAVMTRQEALLRLDSIYEILETGPGGYASTYADRPVQGVAEKGPRKAARTLSFEGLPLFNGIDE